MDPACFFPKPALKSLSDCYFLKIIFRIYNKKRTFVKILKKQRQFHANCLEMNYN